MSEPNIIQKRAIDVTPWRHAIWCSVGDDKPFANTIEHRSWASDGIHIWFMLGTHNFYKARPDELMDVIETDYHLGDRYAARDAKCMARPTFNEGEAY